MTSIFDIMLRLGQMYAAQMRFEFEEQGHKLSEKTWQSMRPKIGYDGKDGLIDIVGASHIIFVNQGRRPGARKVPIEPLLAWMRKRNFPERGKEARSIAFAIREAIFKQGSPTSGAYKYSRNNKRRGFIADAAEEVEPMVVKKLEAELKRIFETQWALNLKANGN